MAVFCNPDTLVTISRDESKRDELEALGFVLVTRAAEPAGEVKPAKKPGKKSAE